MSRYTLFPILPEEQAMFVLFQKATASFWVAEEIQFDKDKIDWKTLNKQEQYFIKHILAFFAGSDGIVQENLALRFQAEATSPVTRLFYGMQNAMEGIHSQVYSMLIDQYVAEDEKAHYFDAINTISCIRDKADWALRWIGSSEDFATRLVAFACVEGIFFSGAFCSIFWLKKRGIMPGLTFSNELISRDEGLHTEFAVTLYHTLQPLPATTIHDIVRSAVELETAFICDALPCTLIGMSAPDMTKYIQFVADRLLVQLGVPQLYKVQNPFDFMDLISLSGKTNFFEKKVSDYSKMSSSDMEIRLDEAF
jgi:ribonucleotide reductase beta subunit family protein with ferritin-like domain